MRSDRIFRTMIPGENLTAQSKNYAWHRPPQYAKFDDAYEWFSDEVFGDGERLSNISILLSGGLTALSITQTILVQAVATGKISPDMSIIIAGPVYKTLTRLMDLVGVPYLTGYDTPEEMQDFVDLMNSGEFFSSSKPKKLKVTKAQEKEMQQITEEVKAEIPSGGLMGAPDSSQKLDIPMDASKKGLVEKPQEEEVIQ